MAGIFARLVGSAALACLASGVQAQGRPLSPADVVAMRSFGSAAIAPGGRRAVYERRGPYEASPRFDFGHRSAWGGSALFLVDLHAASSPQRLLPQEGGGLILGAWSPSGARLLIYRFRNARLEAGVVTMADGSVIWTGLTPDFSVVGASVAWRDDDRLVMTVRPDDSLPWMLRWDGGGQTETMRRWAQMRQGREPSRTVIDTIAGTALASEARAPLHLVEVTTADGRWRTLAKGRILDIALSPDRRLIAVRAGGDPVPIPETEPIVQSAVSERGRVLLVDLGTGRQTVFPDTLDVGPHLLGWSPTSDALLVWARQPGQSWAGGGLVRLDQDGSFERIGRGGLDPFSRDQTLDDLHAVRADWMAGRPILYARQPWGDRFDWHRLDPGAEPFPLTSALPEAPARLAAISENELLFFSDGALWAVDGAGRTRRRSPANQVVADATINDLMKPLRLRVNATPKRDWALGRTPDGAVTVLGAGPSATWRADDTPCLAPRVLDASPEAAVTLCGARGVQTLVARGPGGQRVIDRVNDEFADRVVPAAKAVDHPDRHGVQTTSQLFLPPDTPEERVKGILVLVYPGAIDTGVQSDPTTLLYGVRASLLAGLGYAVLSPSIPIDGHGDNTITGFEESVKAAVDAMLAGHPGLPADRIAIMGHSFGGYAALALSTRPNRYRSVVSWAGPSDLFGQWGEFTPLGRILPVEEVDLRGHTGWVEAGQAGLGAPPWERPQAYAEASPYLHADRIIRPVLLITADRDFVPQSQSERLFTALNRRGLRSRLVTYWGEGHFNWSPANIRDVYAQIDAWLVETLADPDPTPAAASAPPRSAPSPRSPPSP